MTPKQVIADALESCPHDLSHDTGEPNGEECAEVALAALRDAGLSVVPKSLVDAARDVADPSVDWAHGGGISRLGALDRELDEVSS